MSSPGKRTGRSKPSSDRPRKRSSSRCPLHAKLRLVHDLNNVLLLMQYQKGERLRQRSGSVIDVNETVRRVVTMLRGACGPKVRLRTSCRAPRANVRGGATDIKQMLVNLVLNACDAMPSGGVIRIRTVQAVRVPSQGSRWTYRRERVIIEVSDNGSGIPEHMREKVFQPFVTSKPNAKGLGLAAAYRIVQRLGGSIELIDDAEGTRIQVILPCCGRMKGPGGGSSSARRRGRR